MPTPTKGPRLGGSRRTSACCWQAWQRRCSSTAGSPRRRQRRASAPAGRAPDHLRRGDLHARRRVLTVVRDKGVVHTLFTEIGPRYEHRAGGYTHHQDRSPQGRQRADGRDRAGRSADGGARAVGEAERARGTRFFPDSVVATGPSVAPLPALPRPSRRRNRGGATAAARPRAASRCGRGGGAGGDEARVGGDDEAPEAGTSRPRAARPRKPPTRLTPSRPRAAGRHRPADRGAMDT